MNKAILILFHFFISITCICAQDKFYTKSGKIELYSKAELEDIDAKNKTAAVLLDTKTGIIQISVLMKSFEFEKALMQEHFNSDYVESDKFPKGEFKGIIINNNNVNYKKDGVYPIKVSGSLSMHNVTQKIEVPGTIKIEDGKISAESSFTILLSDYKIKIPAIVKEKVSKVIKISVDCKLDELK